MPERVPEEFTAAFVADRSPVEEQLYTAFWRCGEPFRSMFKANPWLMPPDTSVPLPDDEMRYWNTTVARKHPYWRNVRLPQPSRDIRELRRNLHEWGFALLAEGLSQSQCAAFLERLLDQARPAIAGG